MRTILVPSLALGVMFTFTAVGQVLAPQVVAAGGAEARDPGFGSLAWTVGEPVIETFGDTLVLTQGFHQVFEALVSVQPSPSAPFTVGVYPNPAGEFLFIRVIPMPEKAWVTLSDLTGRILLAADLRDSDQRLDVARLPAGTYIATVRTPGFIARSLLLDILHP